MIPTGVLSLAPLVRAAFETVAYTEKYALLGGRRWPRSYAVEAARRQGTALRLVIRTDTGHRFALLIERPKIEPLHPKEAT